MAGKEEVKKGRERSTGSIPADYQEWIRMAAEEEIVADPDEIVTKGGKPRNIEVPIKELSSPSELDYEQVKKPKKSDGENQGNQRKKLLAAGVAVIILAVAVITGIRLFAGASKADRVLQRDYGCIGDETTNELMTKEQTIFGSFDRDSFTAVKFLDTIKAAPENAVDVSETKKGKVLAWIEDDTLYIAAKGGVIANNDSSRLFAYCDNLESADFNDCFDTGSATLMNHLFYRCGRLREVRFAGVDTGNVTSMQRMFVHCQSLTDPDVSKFDTKNVNTIYAMFRECTSLQALDLSDWDTSKVSNMSRLFEGCTSLAQVELGDFDTSFVTNMSYMFYNCYVLNSVDVSSFNTSNVTDMMAMFSNCTSLRSLSVGNFDTSNVVDMSYMFNKCGSLAVLNVGNFDVSNVQDVQSMFYGCQNVQGYEDWGFSDSDLFGHK